jgi:hypothetical protein
LFACSRPTLCRPRSRPYEVLASDAQTMRLQREANADSRGSSTRSFSLLFRRFLDATARNRASGTGARGAHLRRHRRSEARLDGGLAPSADTSTDLSAAARTCERRQGPLSRRSSFRSLARQPGVDAAERGTLHVDPENGPPRLLPTSTRLQRCGTRLLHVNVSGGRGQPRH